VIALKDLDDDDEEHFVDVAIDDDDDDDGDDGSRVTAADAARPTDPGLTDADSLSAKSSWIHRNHLSGT